MFDSQAFVSIAFSRISSDRRVSLILVLNLFGH